MSSFEDEAAMADEERFEEASNSERPGEEGFGFLDDWMADLDLEGLVRRYPLPAVALAAAGGFLLARTKGSTVMNALSSFAVGQVADQVNAALGQDVL
jgi:hypothetical protein